MVRLLISCALAALVMLHAAVSAAQTEPVPEPAPAPAPDPSAEKMEEAKALFRKGVELFNAGDLERALDLFMRSRAAYPSIQNTSNAAICLNKLGRYDEALELYEQILTEFSSGLAAREKEALVPAMAELRARVGSLFIEGNVAGAIVIDGRSRGSLPLAVPVRLLPGSRVVRVIKDGYATFERTVTIEAEKTQRIEAKLSPLANAGLLRVEVADAAGLAVYVDGAPLGESPWEGTLGPGEHVVWTEKGDIGSAPKAVTVVQGQKAVVQLVAGPLGAPASIEVRPETAAIAIGGVRVGQGAWRGRLPQGSYPVRAFEAGYHAKTVALRVDGQREREPLTIALVVDADHPRWPKAPEGALFVELDAGYLLGGTLGSDAEDNCAECPGAPLVHGFIAALRGGYRFAPGVSLELAVGYLRLHSSFDRVLAIDTGDPDYADLTYAVHDALVVHGPFGGLGIGYRVPFGGRFAFTARLFGGALFASATDDISAQARTGGQTAPVVASDDDPVSRATTVFAQADVGVSVLFGSLELGLSLGADVIFLDGPTLDGRRWDIARACDETMGPQVGCTQSGLSLADEKAHGVVALGSPQLRVGYAF